MLSENEEERKEQDNDNASASTADNAAIETDIAPNDSDLTATATDVISEINSVVKGLDSNSLSTTNIDIKI